MACLELHAGGLHVRWMATVALTGPSCAPLLLPRQSTGSGQAQGSGRKGRHVQRSIRPKFRSTPPASNPLPREWDFKRHVWCCAKEGRDFSKGNRRVMRAVWQCCSSARLVTSYTSPLRNPRSCELTVEHIEQLPCAMH